MNKNQLIHGAFDVTVAMKGLAGVVEIVAGLSFLFFRLDLQYYIHHISHGTYYFIAFYLLFYGVVNIFLVTFLLLGKLWAYPTAIVCFGLFTVYMFIRFFLNHSVALGLFAVYDVFLIVLTWLEYQRLRKTQVTIDR